MRRKVHKNRTFETGQCFRDGGAIPVVFGRNPIANDGCAGYFQIRSALCRQQPEDTTSQEPRAPGQDDVRGRRHVSGSDNSAR